MKVSRVASGSVVKHDASAWLLDASIAATLYLSKLAGWLLRVLRRSCIPPGLFHAMPSIPAGSLGGVEAPPHAGVFIG